MSIPCQWFHWVSSQDCRWALEHSNGFHILGILAPKELRRRPSLTHEPLYLDHWTSPGQIVLDSLKQIGRYSVFRFQNFHPHSNWGQLNYFSKTAVSLSIRRRVLKRLLSLSHPKFVALSDQSTSNWPLDRLTISCASLWLGKTSLYPYHCKGAAATQRCWIRPWASWKSSF